MPRRRSLAPPAPALPHTLRWRTPGQLEMARRMALSTPHLLFLRLPGSLSHSTHCKSTGARSAWWQHGECGGEREELGSTSAAVRARGECGLAASQLRALGGGSGGEGGVRRTK